MKIPHLQLSMFNNNPDIHSFETIRPAGLIYIPNFISNKTAHDLLDMTDQSPWITDLKRRVQHYGYKYDYSSRTAGPSTFLGPLPDWAAHLANTLYEQGYFKRPPDQVIVNEYMPGQGISAHIDAVHAFGETIASLSLNGTCIMDFLRTTANKKEKYSQILDPNSLVILSGPARYDWTHEIPARQSDIIGGQKCPRTRRVSLTFRTIKSSP